MQCQDRLRTQFADRLLASAPRLYYAARVGSLVESCPCLSRMHSCHDHQSRWVSCTLCRTSNHCPRHRTATCGRAPKPSSSHAAVSAGRTTCPVHAFPTCALLLVFANPPIAVISRTPLQDTLNHTKLFQNSMSHNNQSKTPLPFRLTLGEELVCQLYGWWRRATR